MCIRDSSARIEWPSADNFLAGLAILAVATLVIRPLSVYVSTLFSPLKFAERTMVAYVSPRGIVAAAVSALFALRLEEQGISGANELVALTFMIIIGTVVLQSVTAARVARWLDVVQPQSRGVLIVGSSELPRLLAQALQKQEIPVLVADDDWQGISQCRMTGIPTYFGNPVSEHAEAALPLSSMRWLLAMSTRIEMNSLACMRYRGDFAKNNVLRMRLLGTGEAPRQSHAKALQTPAIFAKGITHALITQRLGEGWQLRTTRMSVTPVSRSPLAMATVAGQAPRYCGSSEVWRLKTPDGGAARKSSLRSCPKAITSAASTPKNRAANFRAASGSSSSTRVAEVAMHTVSCAPLPQNCRSRRIRQAVSAP